MSVEQSDCVGSSLTELRSFILSELQITPIFCVLVNSPSFFCTLRFWVCPYRIELLPDLDWRSSRLLL